MSWLQQSRNVPLGRIDKASLLREAYRIQNGRFLSLIQERGGNFMRKVLFVIGAILDHEETQNN